MPLVFKIIHLLYTILSVEDITWGWGLASCKKSEAKGHFGLCYLVLVSWADLELKCTNVKPAKDPADDQNGGFLGIFHT